MLFIFGILGFCIEVAEVSFLIEYVAASLDFRFHRDAVT
jgi:hypothetical protein